MINIKLNWGLGIIIFIAAFIIWLVGFVIFSTNQNFELVDKNYYEKELTYQKQIDKMKRADALPEHLSIISINEGILVKFPSLFSHSDITGTIILYRPSDSRQDKTIAIQPDMNYIQIIPTNNLIKGLWTVKVEWKARDTSYYNEAEIILK